MFVFYVMANGAHMAHFHAERSGSNETFSFCVPMNKSQILQVNNTEFLFVWRSMHKMRFQIVKWIRVHKFRRISMSGQRFWRVYFFLFISEISSQENYVAKIMFYLSFNSKVRAVWTALRLGRTKNICNKHRTYQLLKHENTHNSWSFFY